jgi:hypothetical protein
MRRKAITMSETDSTSSGEERGKEKAEQLKGFLKDRWTLILLILSVGMIIIVLNVATLVIEMGKDIVANQDRNSADIRKVLDKQAENFNESEKQRQGIANRLVSFLSLYLCELEEDIDKIKIKENITNNDRVVNNGTHIKQNGKYVLELPIECVPNPH